MNKYLFYCVGTALSAISFLCLLISSIRGQPAEFIGILIACLLISTLIFVIEEGQGVGTFILILFLISVAGYSAGVINAMMNVLPYDPFDTERFILTNTLGIRWLSLIWSVAVLAIGTNNYDKKEE